MLDHLLEPGRHGEQRLAGPGPPVERDDLDRRIEQQLEGEALLLRAGAQSPRLRYGVREQPELGPDPPRERRLGTRPQHGELVLGDRFRPPDRGGVDGGRGVQPVDHLARGLDGRPSGEPGRRDAPGRPVLSGGDPEVGGLDPQRGVVGHDRGRAPLRLSEGGTDDAVVGGHRIEAVLDE